MKFLVDAHLPRRLAKWLNKAGHDAIHTLDLPKGNRTRDNEIIDIAEREQRIVITKDADFVDSFTLFGKPSKLFLVSTGNITNAELEALFTKNIAQIATAFQTNSYAELNRLTFIIHV